MQTQAFFISQCHNDTLIANLQASDSCSDNTEAASAPILWSHNIWLRDEKFNLNRLLRSPFFLLMKNIRRVNAPWGCWYFSSNTRQYFYSDRWRVCSCATVFLSWSFQQVMKASLGVLALKCMSGLCQVQYKTVKWRSKWGIWWPQDTEIVTRISHLGVENLPLQAETQTSKKGRKETSQDLPVLWDWSPGQICEFRVQPMSGLFWPQLKRGGDI